MHAPLPAGVYTTQSWSAHASTGPESHTGRMGGGLKGSTYLQQEVCRGHEAGLLRGGRGIAGMGIAIAGGPLHPGALPWGWGRRTGLGLRQAWGGKGLAQGYPPRGVPCAWGVQPWGVGMQLVHRTLDLSPCTLPQPNAMSHICRITVITLLHIDNIS